MNEAAYVLAATAPKAPPTVLIWVQIILLFMGGILAISGLLISKKPNAKQIIDRLVPFQALIGVGLLAVALILLFTIGPINAFKGAGHGLYGMAIFGIIAAGVLLGFLFGMPQIAKWLPGQSTAETKAMELAQTLAAFQVIIGLVGLAAATLAMLFALKILSVTTTLGNL